MKAIIINPFLDATINLFRRMFHLDPQPGTPHLVEAFGNHRWEVSGVISFLGSNIGVVVIRMPHLLADKLLERSGILVDSADQREQMINEMVGEFTNIIAGNAVGPLSKQGIELEMSPPIVVQGKNHRIHWPNHAPIIGMPFTTEVGPFSVDVSMKNIDIM
ncbi:MAG: chemotaxis protein CheX [Spirochaetota bacterium]